MKTFHITMQIETNEEPKPTTTDILNQLKLWSQERGTTPRAIDVQDISIGLVGRGASFGRFEEI